ncbi:serine/threonine-protein phosphatase 2A 56 kDa regulatory subunit delta isoform [Coemansia spiralis]|uniref:Serine/threonine-protein phosphatase 2A 56 kDa regulatory subunit delta isoform n=2 Tax=Coemansia TaxID=4863 RepID=A0A9W8G8Y2_9FUNG|nr:phosphatase 2A regulatory B subunit-domain-containing protein [Coemansia spiralis]KAJ1991323.1 serine/threonine-protein phosphatase 2A 56 kDa regulatory subunit delta isoform [Coemansia umbellata]KAJ2622180.1 serine/threonine-protein phosphatase 2A 56 kDa regulatory subunit delta isoform [Coemansia sp. RSA 1358]KAJ2678390.1 serine/threonine-protein phosphatase 2A 56 kDa regulatory subunit delta isoform [Coemansia spiralis]
MLEQQGKSRKTGAAATEMVRPRKSAESFSGSGRLFVAQVDEVPTLRVTRRPQSSSRHSFGGKHEFRILPSLSNKDMTEPERKDLFIQKLVQCSVVFDFQNPNESIEAKEAKQQTLVEIIDYMSERTGVFTADVYPALFKMVSANLFRTIPPQINAFGDPFDPEEDEPREEPAWPHLCLVYHIFLRFLESGDFNNSTARPFIDQAFTTQLLELFDCEDVRERESLKTVLHRIYGKMLGMRSFIRRSINNIFLQFTYETQRHNGIAELLEILGSIINGFTVPLKDEHINFLHRVLLPLHKARPMTLYYAQLAYCTVQFLEKDPMLAGTIIKSLLRYWPKVNSPKEVMYVNELEGILDVIDPSQFAVVCQPLFQQLIKCIVSPHFQVAERTLGMWRNNYFVNLITDNIHLILPIALSGIYRHSRSHWNRNIHNQVYQILRFFVNVNEELFEQCLADFRRQRDLERKRAKKHISWWTSIEKMAIAKNAAMPQTQPFFASTNQNTLPEVDSHTNTDEGDKSETTLPGKHEHSAASSISETGSTPAENGVIDGTKSTNGYEVDQENIKVKGADEEELGDSADHWDSNAGELPMSRLDDPETMCCEMDEDEFIQELDKFVDIIRSEDPDTALANGMMILDESDGSAIIDETLGAPGQNAYMYSQQHQQHNQHHHVAMLQNIMSAGDGMDPHIVMDPSSMQVDYATGSFMSSDIAHAIPSSIAHSGMGSSVALYHDHSHRLAADSIGSHGGHEYMTVHSMSDSGRISPTSHENLAMTVADVHPDIMVSAPSSVSAGSKGGDALQSDAADAPMIISPLPSGRSAAVVSNGDSGTYEMANGGMSMDTSSTPPPQMSA